MRLVPPDSYSTDRTALSAGWALIAYARAIGDEAMRERWMRAIVATGADVDLDAAPELTTSLAESGDWTTLRRVIDDMREVAELLPFAHAAIARAEGRMAAAHGDVAGGIGAARGRRSTSSTRCHRSSRARSRASGWRRSTRTAAPGLLREALAAYERLGAAPRAASVRARLGSAAERWSRRVSALTYRPFRDRRRRVAVWAIHRSAACRTCEAGHGCCVRLTMHRPFDDRAGAWASIRRSIARDTTAPEPGQRGPGGGPSMIVPWRAAIAAIAAGSKGSVITGAVLDIRGGRSHLAEHRLVAGAAGADDEHQRRPRRVEAETVGRAARREGEAARGQVVLRAIREDGHLPVDDVEALLLPFVVVHRRREAARSLHLAQGVGVAGLLGGGRERVGRPGQSRSPASVPWAIVAGALMVFLVDNGARRISLHTAVP